MGEKWECWAHSMRLVKPGNRRNEIMAVKCDMYPPITASKMLRVSVKRIKGERRKQL